MSRIVSIEDYYSSVKTSLEVYKRASKTDKCN